MIIDCISDLHGHYPDLEGGDLLIVAGDLTARDTQDQHMQFMSWIAQQKYRKKIWISGNHDNYLVGTKFIPIKELGMECLCDSGTEFEGLKIWGSPWTLKFDGMNPKCMAFTCDTEEEIASKFSLIPKDTDILITHSPPFGILDMTKTRHQVGSTSLMAEHLTLRINPRLWVFGHVHESFGTDGPYKWNRTKYINASYVNEYYHPVNAPVRVIL